MAGIRLSSTIRLDHTDGAPVVVRRGVLDRPCPLGSAPPPRPPAPPGLALRRLRLRPPRQPRPVPGMRSRLHAAPGRRITSRRTVPGRRYSFCGPSAARWPARPLNGLTLSPGGLPICPARLAAVVPSPTARMTGDGPLVSRPDDSSRLAHRWITGGAREPFARPALKGCVGVPAGLAGVVPRRPATQKETGPCFRTRCASDC